MDRGSKALASRYISVFGFRILSALALSLSQVSWGEYVLSQQHEEVVAFVLFWTFVSTTHAYQVSSFLPANWR